LGCSPLWPIAKQREEMSPIPATKTIKRLYYYSVIVFLLNTVLWFLIIFDKIK